MSYKAVIFDCFGVLVEESFNKFCAMYLSDNPEKIHDFWRLDKQASTGELTYVQLVAGAAKLAGITQAKAQAFLRSHPPNEPLFEFIEKELKPRYKIGFLSNSSRDFLDELFTSEQLRLFDDFVLSFRHGMSKPDTKIFELAARRLGVKPSECIFVDDVARYCEGARRAGMTAVQYESFEQARKEISKVLQ